MSGTCASEDHVDLSQYDNCVQMIGILTSKVLPWTYAQFMLENTSVLKVVARESPSLLSKTNNFVKQVNILPIIIFFHIVDLKKKFKFDYKRY